MSQPVSITSESHITSLLNDFEIVVVQYYANRDELSEAIDPFFEELCTRFARPHKVSFARVDIDTRKDVAQSHGIKEIPAIVVFKQGVMTEHVKAGDNAQLRRIVKELSAEADPNSPSLGTDGELDRSNASAEGMWLGTALPKGYRDITNQVDMKGLDLLNADSTFGHARGLFAHTKPSALSSGKSKEKGEETSDWVESDTDEQLMLFMPFNSTLKIHTLHITSLPPNRGDEDAPMRPKTLQIFSNRAHVLGFDEAEGIPATQAITLNPEDWDATTGTAKVELRFVKFQNVTSLVLFIVDGEGASEKVRIDRLRVIGDTGEKRDMGKLEKVGDGGD